MKENKERLLVEYVLYAYVVSQTLKLWEMQKHPSSYPLRQAQNHKCQVIYYMENKLKSHVSQVLAQSILQLMNPVRLGCTMCGTYQLGSLQYTKFHPGMNTP